MNKIEDLSVNQVIKILKLSDLTEFEDIVREKNLDGRQILVSNPKIILDYFLLFF